MSLRTYWRKEAEKLRDKSAALGNLKSIVDTSHLSPKNISQKSANSDAHFEITPETRGVFYIDKDANVRREFLTNNKELITRPRVIWNGENSHVSGVKLVVVIIRPDFFFGRLVQYAYQKFTGEQAGKVYSAPFLLNTYKRITNLNWGRQHMEELLEELVKETGYNPLEDPEFHKQLYESKDIVQCAAYDIDSFYHFAKFSVRKYPELTSLPQDVEKHIQIMKDEPNKGFIEFFERIEPDKRVLYKECSAQLPKDTDGLHRYCIGSAVVETLIAGRSGDADNSFIHTHTMDETFPPIARRLQYFNLLTDGRWVKEIGGEATGGESRWSILYPHYYSAETVEKLKLKYVASSVGKIFPSGPSPQDWDAKRRITSTKNSYVIVEAVEKRQGGIDMALVFYADVEGQYFEVHIPYKLPIL